jgi:hypothetical protein
MKSSGCISLRGYFLRRAEIYSAHPDYAQPAKTRDKLGIGRNIQIVRHKADLPAVAALQALQAGPPDGGNFHSIKLFPNLHHVICYKHQCGPSPQPKELAR